MSRQRVSVLLLSSTFLALTACGGGGGISSTPPAPLTVTPPPPPPPPPPLPTPAGYEAVKIFPGITSSTSFATVGAEISGNASAPITTSGYDVRYDAGSGLYIFDLPTSDPGGFYQKTSNAPDVSYWGGGLIQTSHSGTVWPPMYVLKPAATNPAIQLTYTSFAGYSQAGPMDDLPHGFVAFGSATPAGSVPTTGSASYSAISQGATFDQQNYVTGNASLQFNFGSGTLAGYFDPELIYFYGNGNPIPLGRYDFVNTVYGVGSTTFSGQLSNSAVPGTGTFNGLFTGPNAQELMSNWIAPYRDPTTGQTSQMFGVWVGRRP
jgi:hypothetical protein